MTLWYCRAVVDGFVRSCLVRLDSDGHASDRDEVGRIAAAELGTAELTVRPMRPPLPGRARMLESGDGPAWQR